MTQIIHFLKLKVAEATSEWVKWFKLIFKKNQVWEFFSWSQFLMYIFFKNWFCKRFELQEIYKFEKYNILAP